MPTVILCLFLLLAAALPAQDGGEREQLLRQGVIEDYRNVTNDDKGRAIFSLSGEEARLNQADGHLLTTFVLEAYEYNGDARIHSRKLRLVGNRALWNEKARTLKLSEGFLLTFQAASSDDSTSASTETPDQPALEAVLKADSASLSYAAWLREPGLMKADNAPELNAVAGSDAPTMTLKDVREVEFSGFELLLSARRIDLEAWLSGSRTSSAGGTSGGGVQLTRARLVAAEGSDVTLPDTFKLPVQPGQQQISGQYQLRTLGAGELDLAPAPSSPDASALDLNLSGGVQLFGPDRRIPVMEANSLRLSGANEADASATAEKRTRLRVNHLLATGKVRTTVAGLDGSADELEVWLLAPAKAGSPIQDYDYEFRRDPNLTLEPESTRRRARRLERLSVRALQRVRVQQRGGQFKLSADHQVRMTLAFQSADATSGADVPSQEARDTLQLDGDRVELLLSREQSEASATPSMRGLRDLRISDVEGFACTGSGVLPRMALYSGRNRLFALFSDRLTMHRAASLDGESTDLVVVSPGQSRLNLLTPSTLLASTTRLPLDSAASRSASPVLGRNDARGELLLTAQELLRVRLNNFPLQLNGASAVDESMLAPEVTLEARGSVVLEEWHPREDLRSVLQGHSLNGRVQFQVKGDAWDVAIASIGCNEGAGEPVYSSIGGVISRSSYLQVDYSPEVQQAVLAPPAELLCADPTMLSTLIEGMSLGDTRFFADCDVMRLSTRGSIVLERVLPGGSHKNERTSLRLPSAFTMEGLKLPVQLDPAQGGPINLRAWLRMQSEATPVSSCMTGASLRLQREMATRKVAITVRRDLNVSCSDHGLELRCRGLTLTTSPSESQTRLSGPVYLRTGAWLFDYLSQSGNSGTASASPELGLLQSYAGGTLLVSDVDLDLTRTRSLASAKSGEGGSNEFPQIESFQLQCRGNFQLHGLARQGMLEPETGGDRLVAGGLNLVMHLRQTPARSNAEAVSTGTSERELEVLRMAPHVSLTRAGRTLSGESLDWDPQLGRMLFDGQKIAMDVDKDVGIDGVESIVVTTGQGNGSASNTSANTESDTNPRRSGKVRVRVTGSHIRVKIADPESAKTADGKAAGS